LKNPILAQISSLKLLTEGYFGEISELQKEVLATMLDSSFQMKNLLFSIMKTYKENCGMIKLVKNEFSMKTLIEKNVKEVKNFASEKALKIVTIFEGKDVVEADEIQIRRVIGNLLNNAIQYAFESSEIKIVVFEEEQNIVFRIQTRSLPIPENIKNHIFEKFVCNLDLAHGISTGLGLYYCKKIIEAHNGQIKYCSDNDLNIFEFKIPYKMDTESYVVL
jgi:K+-sensing histidine kinase KdpD